ncbi:SURF1 family cytochrome oxidase biogenesis protein [Glutamicibacter sp.]|uniref:SURF1 family cytochrome oxidase biogenesis protein n=1 Tax=Glutamicibacter sp. TaxID=1931995 RepID=UPI0028BD39CA|nr:SURF1 family cytochrome oxidase biogenesis protein [Glutamicibacter sp.]
MLKTAFKPKWLLALLAALLLATGFVALSGWQFGSSETEPPVKAETTEKAVPLVGHHEVGTELLGNKADQIVTMNGKFVKGTDELIAPRIEDGKKGVWVVSEFKVDGAPDDATIAVVRGWQPEANTPSPVPDGELKITGRLMPTEGPENEHDLRSPTLETLSSAQLANIWDSIMYSGFVVAHDTQTADGADVQEPGITEIFIGPQPQEAQVNWLNVFYGIEWVVFAGFALFLWYRMVRDDYQRDMEQIAEQAAAQAKKNAETQTDDEQA